MTVSIAFAGTGYIAKLHARAPQNLPGVEPAAVAGHRPALSEPPPDGRVRISAPDTGNALG